MARALAAFASSLHTRVHVGSRSCVWTEMVEVEQIEAVMTLRRTDRARTASCPSETVLSVFDVERRARAAQCDRRLDLAPARAAPPGDEAGAGPGRALLDRPDPGARRRRRVRPRDDAARPPRDHSRLPFCLCRLYDAKVHSSRTPRKVLVGVVARSHPTGLRRPTRSRVERPSPAPRTPPPGCQQPTTGRRLSVGRRQRPTVSTCTRCSRRMVPKASTISKKDSPRWSPSRG